MTRTKNVAGCIVAAAVVTIVALILVVNVQGRTKYKGAFTTTLDRYLSNRPECLWPDPIQLPARADADNSAQIARFDALVDAGLLNRAPPSPSTVDRERQEVYCFKSIDFWGWIQGTKRGSWRCAQSDANRSLSAQA